ncbi:Glycerate kinase [Corynebacterium camporealensis]|uniref:Glycerate kinase n=2 Tax=Corynebacterium camporealensis TaxID=161896 RepID=A0A0F6QXB8_9CORY|nr:glycerate kinase [Corynebacterium camporealensis]AVH88618.1 Glycerate kinase [Corynebacterium camporealensis]
MTVSKAVNVSFAKSTADILIPMLVIVAPDSFKGTASAQTAAAAIASGVREVLPDATVLSAPMADGGEETADVLASAAALRGAKVERITLPTTDAIGRLTEASYAFDTTNHTAYIDVAAASGLPAVADSLDPLHADTYGTGVLIADAEARGATHIVLGLGGSATVDGGVGILSALGAAVHDERGYALPKGGAPLVQLDTIDTAQLNIKAALLDYTLVADTRATVVQAATMYAPQKGAEGEQIALLAGALLQLAKVTEQDPEQPYFGAAGGIPIALRWLSMSLWGDESHFRIVPGGKFVAEQIGLSQKIPDADLVITGEGAFDEQSLTGKAVGTIAELCAEANVPLGIVAGRIDEPAPEGTHAAELSGEGPLPEQLREAGKKLAEALK